MSLTNPNPNSPRPLGKPKKSVAWFGLKTLAKSAKEASAATQFARFADARQAQAGVAPSYAYELADVTTGPFVMDYVADTGDGYDATFAIARSVDGSITGEEDPLGTAPVDRAHLLVMGGDQVYPFASVEAYDERLSRPFADAVRHIHGDGRGFLVALPGNHDWYDGLNQFRRNFCESFLRQETPARPQIDFVQRPPAGGGDPLLDRWLFQSRSYFAVHLPHGWWLWGVDCQLDSYIDTAQLAYFTQARKLIGPYERVILCFPRPSWTDDGSLDNDHYVTNRQTVTWFVERMFGVSPRGPGLSQASLVISGDKHHYVRHVRGEVDGSDVDAPKYLITCGGGGAYLSSTHHARAELEVPWHPPSNRTTRYKPVEPYPTFRKSWALRWLFFRIPFVNGFGFPALLALVGTSLYVGLSLLRTGHDRASAVLLLCAGVPTTAFLVGFAIAFGRKRRPRSTGIAMGAMLGILHAAGHAGSAWLVSAKWLATDGGLTLLLGAFVASVSSWVVFSLYLFLCDVKVIHWHENELFSGMRLKSYKSHLRIEIRPPDNDATTGGSLLPVAGPLEVVVHTIRKPVRNRPIRLLRRTGRKNSSVVDIHDRFQIP